MFQTVIDLIQIGPSMAAALFAYAAETVGAKGIAIFALFLVMVCVAGCGNGSRLEARSFSRSSTDIAWDPGPCRPAGEAFAEGERADRHEAGSHHR